MEDLFTRAARSTRSGFTHWVVACAAAAIGSVLTWAPASAEQNERQHDRSRGAGKRVPTVLATPPFLVEVNQTPSCAIVNLGTVPLEVTFTLHAEGELTFGTSNSGTTFTLAPGLRRVTKFPFGFNRSLNPIPVYCKFESTDTRMLRAAGYVGTDFDLGGIVRAVAAE